MPDITMCNATKEKCPIRDRCYRFTAAPTPKWQSYWTEAPYNPEKQACIHFWDNEGYKKATPAEREGS
jgi:hypothetical protein